MLKPLVIRSDRASDTRKAVVAACKELATHPSGPGKTVRAMVVGIPNVGKSTLINTLMERKVAKTGDEPAVRFTDDGGVAHEVRCELLVGSDGSRGVCRGSVPAGERRRRAYFRPPTDALSVERLATGTSSPSGPSRATSL